MAECTSTTKIPNSSPCGGPAGEIACERTVEHETHFNRSHCQIGHSWASAEPIAADRDLIAEAYIAGYLDATMSNCLDVVFGVFHVTPPEPVELPAEAVADAIAGMRREVPAAIEWARARLAKIAAATPKN
ncbi:hypothetical protein ACFXOH_23000 [Bacillus subtilis]